MPAAQLLRSDEVPAGRAQVLFQLGHGRRQGDQAFPGLAQLKVLLLQQLLQLLDRARVILQGQRAISPAVPHRGQSPGPPTPLTQQGRWEEAPLTPDSGQGRTPLLPCASLEKQVSIFTCWLSLS